jgi:polyhydroxyalkanoate synthesis regulator protein
MNQFEPSPILIKLYPNRRFYDGEVGQYRSFDELKVWKERHILFAIVDSKDRR